MALEALLTTQIIGLQPLLDAKLGGTTGSTDNRVLRSDGAGGVTVQASPVTIDDSGNISGANEVSCLYLKCNPISTSSGPGVWWSNNYAVAGNFVFVGNRGDFDGESHGFGNNNGGNAAYFRNGAVSITFGSDVIGIGVSNDVQLLRNATGPSAEIRAAGCLLVKNAAGSADAALACGAITASGSATINAIPASGALTLVPSATHNDFYGLNLCSNTGGSVRASFWIQPTSGEIRIGGVNGGGYFPTIYSNGAQALGFATTGAATFAKTVSVGTYTFGTLPAAASNAGALAQITDSSVTTNGTIAAGGGSDRAIVFSDGTDWIVAVA